MGATADSRGIEQNEAASLRRAVEESLREREISFSTLARIAPVGILRFDALGRCNYANERWCQMTGLTIDEAIGEGWMNAVHVEDRAAILSRWTSLRQRDERFREEYRLCTKEGGIRWVFAEGAALRGYSGEPLGFIRAVTDITRHRQLEHELGEARAALEERVRERTAELEAQIAERQKLEKQVLATRDQEQRRFSQDLHDGLGQHLIGMLFRISALQHDLEIAQSPHAADAAEIVALVKEASDLAHQLARGVDPVPLRPDGLVVALQELMEKLCHTTRMACHFECEEPVHIDDHGAATHLYRIAQEAITNAIKYSGASNIAVRLRTAAETAELSITDDGRGFARETPSGTGRGLNIMRHRARLVDGALEVNSSNAGTMVRCTFQLARPRVA